MSSFRFHSQKRDMHPHFADQGAQEVRSGFRRRNLSVSIGPLARSDKPSQQTSPPATPHVDTFSQETEGIQNLKLGDSDRIEEDDEPLVAVIGCGYVGTQLIGSFSTKYDVLGFDVSKEQLRKVEEEHGGEGSRTSFTLDPRDLTRATHFLISVPTLLKADKTIDTSYVRSALMNIRKYARQGSTVVIESSVAIGMTRQLLGPLAEEKGFYAGMSPERVDPGRTDPPMKEIPKVLSGLDDVVPGSLNAITRLYSRVFDTIVPVSTPETAEMTKLYENCQRMIAISYANEMADACVGHGIDPYEVCKAAATKPFGYTPFTPGLGVGGHCIPVNPYYLIANSEFPLLKFATETMWQRPEKIGLRALEVLFRDRPQSVDAQPAQARRLSITASAAANAAVDFENMFLGGKPTVQQIERRVSVSSAANRRLSYIPMIDYDTAVESGDKSRPRVLVVGVGFKAGQSHLSNSPGLRLLQTLFDSGRVDVMFADALVEQSAIPHIPRLSMDGWNKETLDGFDMIIVAFKQTGMDFKVLEQVERARVEMWCP